MLQVRNRFLLAATLFVTASLTTPSPLAAMTGLRDYVASFFATPSSDLSQILLQTIKAAAEEPSSRTINEAIEAIRAWNGDISSDTARKAICLAFSNFQFRIIRSILRNYSFPRSQPKIQFKHQIRTQDHDDAKRHGGAVLLFRYYTFTLTIDRKQIEKPFIADKSYPYPTKISFQVNDYRVSLKIEHCRLWGGSIVQGKARNQLEENLPGLRGWGVVFKKSTEKQPVNINRFFERIMTKDNFYFISRRNFPHYDDSSIETFYRELRTEVNTLRPPYLYDLAHLVFETYYPHSKRWKTINKKNLLKLLRWTQQQQPQARRRIGLLRRILGPRAPGAPAETRRKRPQRRQTQRWSIL